MKNNKGFTLFELIAVLAIIAIVASITAPRIFKTIGNSKRITCTLNKEEIVRNYHVQKVLKPNLAFEDYFQDIDNYFEEDVNCPSGLNYTYDDNKVICPIHGFTYVKLSVDQYVYYPFFDSNFDEDLIEEIIYHEQDDWQFEELNGTKYYTNTTTNQNRFFLENDLENYRIVTNAILEGNNGYGVLFESVTESDANDSGYVFQFDKGFSNFIGFDDGRFVIRERENGSEDSLYSPKWMVAPEDVINNYNQATYWHEEHEIAIEVVKINSDEKRVKIFIDGIDITSTTNEPIITKIFEGDKRYFGFRTWGSSKVYIKDVRIDKLN